MPSSTSSARSSPASSVFDTPRTSSSSATEPSVYNDDDAPAYSAGPAQVPDRKRRKSVAFSTLDTVISAQDREESEPTPTQQTRTPFGNSSNIPSPRTHQRPSVDSSGNCGPEAAARGCVDIPGECDSTPLEVVSITSRKRRFTHVGAPHPNAPHLGQEAKETPRNGSKRASIGATPHLQWSGPVDADRVTDRRIRRASVAELYASSGSEHPVGPPAQASTRRRYRDTLDLAAQGHRKYVVDKLQFDDASECVIVLEAGVERLLPPTFAPVKEVPKDPVSVTVAQAEGMGMGVFAMRPIRAHEVIVVDRPVIIAPSAVDIAIPLERMYADVVHKLSPDVLVQLRAFAHGNENKSKRKSEMAMDYESILRTHGLCLPLDAPPGTPVTHRAVFLVASRCNHSCGPSATWEWDASCMSFTLTAARTISPGEEVTIAYVSPYLPFAARAQLLRTTYDFACRCPHCAQSTPRRAESDAARAFLATFWDTRRPSVAQWCGDPTLPRDLLLTPHLRAIEAIRREGLHALASRAAPPPVQSDLALHIDAVVTCYGALGDAAKFRLWVQAALDVHGETRTRAAQAFRKWLTDPSTFPVWGRRNR